MYTGEYNNDISTGFGLYEHANGDLYIGEWANDKKGREHILGRMEMCTMENGLMVICLDLLLMNMEVVMYLTGNGQILQNMF